MIKKNDTYQVEILDQGIDGEGIAKIEDITIFIEGAIIGEIVDILIVKVLSTFAYGKIINIVRESKYRQEPDCLSYSKCGGCSLRHMDYGQTLKLKTEIVKNCFYKSLHRQVEINECIGMEKPLGYRNKLIYPVGYNKEKKPIIGVYAKRTHDIVPVQRCYLQNEKNEKIAKDVLKFCIENEIAPYDEESRSGILRHIIVRSGYQTGEIMLILVLNCTMFPKELELTERLIRNYPEIKTIVKNINDKDTNVILSNENITLYGRGFIYDNLGGYQFKISPNSFYQVNPIQTERLYNIATDYADLTGKETVFDLYCGIGTIGIFASRQAKKVYGIEVVQQAIRDAEENKRINGVDNIEFMTGEVENLLPMLVAKTCVDVVFLDPPRKGCDKKALDTLLSVQPKKIVYISCNSATLARDVAILEERYELGNIQPVDMFPFTSHVECVAVMVRKDNESK